MKGSQVLTIAMSRLQVNVSPRLKTLTPKDGEVVFRRDEGVQLALGDLVDLEPLGRRHRRRRRRRQGRQQQQHQQDGVVQSRPRQSTHLGGVPGTPCSQNRDSGHLRVKCSKTGDLVDSGLTSGGGGHVFSFPPKYFSRRFESGKNLERPTAASTSTADCLKGKASTAHRDPIGVRVRGGNVGVGKE